MTAFDYIESRADADELIAEFGQSVSLRREVASGPASEPTVTPTDYATQAAILDYNARQIDGENILVTDRRALVAAGPLTLQGVTDIAAPDALLIGAALVDDEYVGGAAIPIVRVQPLNPAGVVVMYDCQLRF